MWQCSDHRSHRGCGRCPPDLHQTRRDARARPPLPTVGGGRRRFRWSLWSVGGWLCGRCGGGLHDGHCGSGSLGGCRGWLGAVVVVVRSAATSLVVVEDAAWVVAGAASTVVVGGRRVGLAGSWVSRYQAETAARSRTTRWPR